LGRVTAEAGSCTVSGGSSGGADGQVRDRAVGAGAVGEAVAAGVDDFGEGGPDGGEVGDLLVDLGDLVDGPLTQVRARVAAPAGVQQVGDLVFCFLF
jgi:hypothetical protein